ncbi:carboxypeptidase-like regulatory domain-containing protein [Mucilaginibacter terrae]|uniref:Macroglobulin domain-containing protein n=1 Tax=Mucilaginibacter terrae TaxID=1955052 RepID=A0ABU3GYJ6_9SPHI|nr:MG2 domain-containing protein [Mucilaginibacter terrae]MDT3404062.1 hypothetical protein [Mucilaginibacter terrae]
MKKAALCIVYAFLICIYILPVYAQTAPAQKQVKLFFEKVFIHTDRQIYTPADDIWFKAYLLNAQDNHLVATSKNLYVEVIAPDNKIIGQEMIALNNGLGNGDFKLPDSLAAGNYSLRAYTNWMRNFGNNFIFEKKLTVVSTKPSAPAVTKAGEFIVRFFPEGGSLVTGLGSIVAVKAEDSSGQGYAVRGAVYTSSGDTVAHYTTDSFGMGIFTLLPLQGQSYQAKTLIKGKPVQSTLPAALNSGLTLKIVRQDTSLYAVVTCNEQSVAAYGQQTLSIKARSFGRVTFQQSFQLKGNTAAVVIPTWQMPGGLAAITLYDGEQKPNCERLIYNTGTEKATLKLSLNKPIYNTREKVGINIQLSDTKGQPLKGELSVSAVDASISPLEESNILSYLMLQSELKGDIKNAARYFDTTNVQHNKQLDILLLTQGWRDFIWKRLADTTLRIAYIPEQGISLSGTVLDKKNVPIPNANVTLIAANAINGRLFGAQTDAQGKYFFDNLQLLGKQKVKLNAKDAKGKPLGSLTLDSLAAKHLPVTNNTLYNTPAMAQLPALTKASLIKQVALARQRSLSDTIIRLKDVEVRTPNRQQFVDRMVTTLGYKDEVLTVTPEDEKLNSLRNYILAKSNQARTNDSNNLVFIADGKLVRPRIVVDNKDAAFSDNDAPDVVDLMSNHYLELPISAVKKVVIKKLVGGPLLMVENAEGLAATTAAASPAGRATQSSKDLGIVFAIYITLNPEGLNKLAVGATQANITGYYEARTFYSPVYNPSKNDNRTDARPTLYWQPNATVNNSGKSNISFYNSDSKSTIRIIVQGIGSNGVPVAGIKTYKIQ